MRLALDLDGGDLAPEAALGGALAYLDEQRSRDVRDELVLIGRRECLQEAHGRLASVERVILHPVASGERPIRAGCELLKENRVDAFVSAGDSAELVVTARARLGRVPGFSRPAIGVLLPLSTQGVALLLDAGANASSSAELLLQFAFMGEAYYRRVLSVPRPRIALLSNGTEPTKGTRELRSAARLLRRTSFDFRGFIEPNDLFAGRADVVVTDGFSGNLLLKTAEGTLAALDVLMGGILKRFDWSERGGAPLLGVEGVCIVAHGRSGPKAIKSALGVASRAARSDLLHWIREGGVAFSAMGLP